jgi:hypothetical protein
MHSPETKEKIRQAAKNQHKNNPRSKKDLLAAVRQFAKDNYGECLTNKIEDYTSKVLLKCQCGNTWEVAVRSILYTKSWCPKKCNLFSSEKRQQTCKGCNCRFESFTIKNFCTHKCYKKHWVTKNSTSLKQKKATYHKANKDKNIQRVNEWRKQNIDKARQYNKKYKSKTKLTRNEKIKHRLRTRINTALKGRLRIGSPIEELGCSMEQFKKHIEDKFQLGMTWENYGRTGWHIDHILPLAAFDLEDPVQFKEACHYTNLQPLWAVDNIKKSDSILDNTIKIPK